MNVYVVSWILNYGKGWKEALNFHRETVEHFFLDSVIFHIFCWEWMCQRGVFEFGKFWNGKCWRVGECNLVYLWRKLGNCVLFEGVEKLSKISQSFWKSSERMEKVTGKNSEKSSKKLQISLPEKSRLNFPSKR
jgi:hypothetical protein